MHRLTGLLLASCLLPFTSATAEEPLLPWEPHDLTFVATRDHAWWEFPLRAVFARKDAAEPPFVAEGFWDGGSKWVVRVAMPQAGRWSWHTESADPGLHGQRGEFMVSPATDEQRAANPNLRGAVRPAANQRHFEYADGTPFLLLASTLWAANTERCGLGENESGPFFRHIADRKTKGFTAILMQYFHGYGDYPDSPGHRNEGGKPYGNDDRAQLNPAHFQALDTRMRALWREGLVAAIPTTWWGKTRRCVFTVEDARRMSDYCAVRYGAFNAIWSLSGEYQYAFKDCGWTEADFTALGEAVQQHNPCHRPLSIHPSGQITWPAPHNVQSSLPFHGQSWLDHHWLQTGQSRDRMFRIVTRLAENRALIPPLPVFCSEAFYERASDAERAYHTRWQVWTAFLNGAAGFGYGADGLWQFFDPTDPQGETGKKTGREVPWQEAEQFEGAAQVVHVRNLLHQFDWWKLEPARERLWVDGQPNVAPTATDLTPPQAATLPNDDWIVYVPRDNAAREITLDVQRDSHWSLQWIAPRTGRDSPTRQLRAADGRLTLSARPAPADEDWVGLVRAVRQPSASAQPAIQQASGISVPPVTMPEIPEGHTGIAAKYPGDVGIENDPDVIWVESFEGSVDEICSHWESAAGKEIMSKSDDVVAGSGGKQSLLLTRVAGGTAGYQGGGNLYRRLTNGSGGFGYDQVYFRFYMKFNAGHAPIHHYGSGLVGFNPPTPWPQGGAGERPQGDTRWSTQVEPANFDSWNFYSYWQEMGGSPPRGETWGNSFESGVPPRVVEKEKWICLEVMAKMNDVGQRNGEQAYWLDGRLSRTSDGRVTSYLGQGFPSVGTWTFDKFRPYQRDEGVAWDYQRGRGVPLEGGRPFPGFAWRNTPALNINAIWLYRYMSRPETGTSQVWWDHLVVARRYIGPLTPVKR